MWNKLIVQNHTRPWGHGQNQHVLKLTGRNYHNPIQNDGFMWFKSLAFWTKRLSIYTELFPRFLYSISWGSVRVLTEACSFLIHELVVDSATLLIRIFWSTATAAGGLCNGSWTVIGRGCWKLHSTNALDFCSKFDSKEPMRDADLHWPFLYFCMIVLVVVSVSLAPVLNQKIWLSKLSQISLLVYLEVASHIFSGEISCMFIFCIHSPHTIQNLRWNNFCFNTQHENR